MITSAIDQQNPNYLTWEQVAEMSAGGMAMEAHCYTHEAMEGRDRDFLIWQMLGSKEAIEERTGETVRFFCYPSGYYDEHAMRVLHELGYWAATTIEFGQEHSSESLFDLHRVRIHGDYTAERLAALLDALRALNEDADAGRHPRRTGRVAHRRPGAAGGAPISQLGLEVYTGERHQLLLSAEPEGGIALMAERPRRGVPEASPLQLLLRKYVEGAARQHHAAHSRTHSLFWL